MTEQPSFRTRTLFKYVLCEKPMAPMTSEIKAIIAAKNASGEQLMTTQHWRGDNTTRQLKAEIKRSKFRSFVA